MQKAHKQIAECEINNQIFGSCERGSTCSELDKGEKDRWNGGDIDAPDDDHERRRDDEEADSAVRITLFGHGYPLDRSLLRCISLICSNHLEVFPDFPGTVMVVILRPPAADDRGIKNSLKRPDSPIGSWNDKISNNVIMDRLYLDFSDSSLPNTNC